MSLACPDPDEPRVTAEDLTASSITAGALRAETIQADIIFADRNTVVTIEGPSSAG